MRDPDEVFRFVWENRTDTGARRGGLHPCAVGAAVHAGRARRLLLRETVAEYMQMRRLRADQLKLAKVRRPAGMPPDAASRCTAAARWSSTSSAA